MINILGKAEAGTSQLVAQAGLTMEAIVASIRGVTDMMSEITTASAEQGSGIEQVNQAIAQMDEVTQQNAALVEQAAAAAESLEEQARNLGGIVSSFKMDDNSGSACRLIPYSTIPVSQRNVSLVSADADVWEEF